MTESPTEWVDLHGQAMFRWAMVQVRDPHVAADLVQEALLAALRAREQFAGDSSLRTWLIGILRHKVLDHFRRHGRERPAADTQAFDALAERDSDNPLRGHWQPSGHGNNAEYVLLQSETQAALADCISRLPERMRIAFAARELDDLPTEEICNLLQVSATNLGVMLFRARSRLRECLTLKGIDLQED
jgi:RNA polymerase sigma-70 factor (ECF subfamily)